MGVGQQRVEIIEAAEDRIDVGVVTDVVAEIRHRRWIDRRNPDCVHAEPLQIIELAPDAGEIAYAIAVAVHKRARIDLIDDAAFPPFEVGELRILSGSGLVNHLNMLLPFNLCFHLSGKALEPGGQFFSESRSGVNLPETTKLFREDFLHSLDEVVAAIIELAPRALLGKQRP